MKFLRNIRDCLCEVTALLRELRLALAVLRAEIPELVALLRELLNDRPPKPKRPHVIRRERIAMARYRYTIGVFQPEDPADVKAREVSIERIAPDGSVLPAENVALAPTDTNFQLEAATGETFTLRLRDADAVGNLSEYSDPLTVLVQDEDVTPPPKPQGFSGVIGRDLLPES